MFISAAVLAQDADSLLVKKDSIKVSKDGNYIVVTDTTSLKVPYDPLAPARAAFYSAVVPGLGQAYNKRYWKIPIIYAGMGAGVYFYLRNDKDYNRFRNAYKRRLAGFTDDEFYGTGTTPVISDDRLIDAQRSAQKNKDVSIIVSVVFYLLNVVDANVDAHLQQYNVNDDLTISPNLDMESVNVKSNYGLTFTYSFQ